MTGLKFRDYDLSDENLLRHISDIDKEHDPFGRVAFAAFRLAVDLEKRLTGGNGDSKLFSYLMHNLPEKFASWSRRGIVIEVGYKDQTYFTVTNGDDPCYYFKKKSN